jgi:hypothetical protein
VLQDRLALASVSLERTASYWDSCRAAVLKASAASNTSVWKNKPLLRSLRNSLRSELDDVLGVDRRKRRCLSRIISALVSRLNQFVTSENCSGLTDIEKGELREVIRARIDNLTAMPNSARLRRPFDDLQIPLSNEENEAILQRNTALHGRQEGDALDIDRLDVSVEYFDRIRMLITKFFLKLCKYEGPYIDYASRPSTGNFVVKTLSDT